MARAPGTQWALTAILAAALLLGGTMAAQGPTHVATQAAPGHAITADSARPSLNQDGSVVAFETASALTSQDTNLVSDIYLHDAATNTTSLVSRAANGQSGNQQSRDPSLSDDGRLVVFASQATNLAGSDINGRWDIFLYDATTGAVEALTAGDGDSLNPAISGDGRYVVFQTAATNTFPGDSNGRVDIVLMRLSDHAVRHVSANMAVAANEDSLAPDISDDGTWITFHSASSNLLSNPNYLTQAFVVQMPTSGGAVSFDAAELTKPLLVSATGSGTPGNGDSLQVHVAGGGRWVSFHSYASNLVANDVNGEADAFLFDALTLSTKRVSLNATGQQGFGRSWFADLNDSGRYLVYESSSDNLVPKDTNQKADVFVYDAQTLSTRRVSVNSTSQGNGDSTQATISGDGARVAFTTTASNLGNASHFADIVIRQRDAAVLPVPDFTWSPQLPRRLEQVQFLDASTDLDGSVVAWLWSFSDLLSNASTQQNPTFSYPLTGDQMVRLVITDDQGHQNTVTKVIRVSNTPPSPSFSWEPTSPSPNQAIQFTSTSSDPDGSILSSSWDFGDGSPPALQANPSHTFSSKGTRLVKLTVTDNDLLSASVTKPVTVYGPKPTVSMVVSPQPALGGNIVNFTSVAQDNEAGDPISTYAWDFGDGQSAATRHADHRYNRPGTYTAKVTVTDGEGQTATATQNIVVNNNPPVASFRTDPGTPKGGKAVQFIDESYDNDGNITSWTWCLGDYDAESWTCQQPLQNTRNATHTYPASIHFANGFLLITDELGAQNRLPFSIATANLEPEADFSVNPGYPRVNKQLVITDSSTDQDGVIEHRQWTFHDGSTVSDDSTLYRTYERSGIYEVQLTVWDNAGGSSQTSRYINVYDLDGQPCFESSQPQRISGSQQTPGPGLGAIIVAVAAAGACLRQRRFAPALLLGLAPLALLDMVPEAAAQSSTSLSPAIGLEPNPPVSGQPTQFLDQSTSMVPANSWQWTFEWKAFTGPAESTQTKSTQNPTVVFPGEGSVTATLKVGNGIDEATVSRALVVRSQAPEARFTYAPNTNLYVGQHISFFDESSDPDGQVTQRYWNLGDGSLIIRDATSLTHAYSQPGDYTVKLRVFDDGSPPQESTASFLLTVSEEPTPACVGFEDLRGTPEAKGAPGLGLAAVLAAVAVAAMLRRR